MQVLKRWLPSILMCTLIFVSSSLPGASVSGNGDVDYSAHKFAHTVVFSLLCFTFYRATKNPAGAAALTSLYGVLDEFHQTFVLTRSGNIIDVAVDTSAAVVTAVVLWKYFHFLPNKLKIWLNE